MPAGCCWLPRQLICFGFGILLYDRTERKSQPTLGAMLLLGASLLTSWGALVAIMSAASLALLPLDLMPMTILVTGLSLALSYYLLEPLLERPCNRFGHVLASNFRRRQTAIA